MPDLPTISIVVPNYNGAATLGRTLQCLLDQQYPRLEILVADGGSTDASRDIIQRYAPHLAWWVSEKDRGQSHAINKGFARCTGEVVNWLCSDDILTPGALLTVGQCFAADPAIDVLVGRCRLISTQPGAPEYAFAPTPDTIALMPCHDPIMQPSCFYRRRLLDRSPPLDESYHYVMDFELWMYFLRQGARFHCIDQELSHFLSDGANKSATGGPKIRRELIRLYRAYVPERIPLSFWHHRLRHPLDVFLMRHPRGRRAAFARWAKARLDALLGRIYGPARVRAMDWRWTAPAPTAN